MKPIRINDYCFDRIHLWVQYDWKIPQFVEVVVEVFFPKNRRASGLVMFNHGFLIGNDLLFYPKKVIGALLGDNPLFGLNPSAYYNYSEAIVEKNWAMAFVSTSHAQVDWMPWTDLGGNPRVGQEAYAAASYLVRYGVTDFFYKTEPKGRNLDFYDADLTRRAKFMVSNNVIFAGHSVGGAHAQAAACGFETLHELGKKDYRPFNPVIFDREFLPTSTERLSTWDPSDRANPVGLLQLSPVDQKMSFIMPGMERYRAALASRSMPMVMVVGQCDCACLDKANSNPPAWSENAGEVTQSTQLSPPLKGSWAVVSCIQKGSHCGYLTDRNQLCSMADKPSECTRCPEVEKYGPAGDEAAFTASLLQRFIDIYPGSEGFAGNFDDWIDSGFIKWLDKECPDGRVSLVPFAPEKYVDYVKPVLP
ncbi:MAG: hypothetical protein HGB02_07100 [Chlorobiaceae bacterium]|nr:hypothetical protein [Chlorobiaceae bacterium]